MNDVKTEYKKAEEMQEADGIAKHGIEGWRLLTGNWEVAIERLQREARYRESAYEAIQELVGELKAKLREARATIREQRRWKTSKSLARKSLARKPSSVFRKARQRKATKNDRSRARR